MKLFLTVIFSLTAGGNASAEKFDCTSATLLNRVTASKSTELLACGSIENGFVPDISIIQRSIGKEDKEVFSGDSAFKTYQFKAIKTGFRVTESLNLKAPLPLIEILVTCTKSFCQARDKKCLWKKQTVDQTVRSDIELIKKSNGVEIRNLDSLISKIFVAALNGNRAAKDFFSKKWPFDADAGETFETHFEDSKRLKKLNCW